MQRFRDAIIQELEVSESILINGNEVTLRFRVLTNNGDYTIHTPFTGDYKQHMGTICIIRCFMIWKRAKAFVMSSKLHEPNAISSAGLDSHNGLAAYEMVTTSPLKFGVIQWLGNSQIDPVFRNILPGYGDSLSEREKQECIKMFGVEGEFRVDRILH